MKPIIQYTAASTRAVAPDSSVDPVASMIAPRAQPRIFPQPDVARRLPTKTDDLSLQSLSTAAVRSVSGTGKDPVPVNRGVGRQKRGAVAGKCASPEFRECRGGDALRDGAASYIKFDQADRSQTRGKNGHGTCIGIICEAMRRIDRNYREPYPNRITLEGAVVGMSNDMRTSQNARASGVYERINLFQESRNALGLQNYEQSTNLDLSLNGSASREDRMNELMTALDTIPPGGLALIGIDIQTAGATSPASNGHALLVQRRPDAAAPDGTPPPHRYVVFDPNNGAFSYETMDPMNAALRNYMGTAFSEIGDAVTLDRATFFDPHNSLHEASSHPEVRVQAPLSLPEPQFPQSAPGTDTARYPHDENR